MKSELRLLLQKMHSGELLLNYGGLAAPARPADLIRVVSEWSQKDILDLTIRNIIVNAILSSENKQIGSGIICAASMLHGNCDDLLKTKLKKTRAVREDLSDTLRYFLGGAITYDLCETLIDMGSMSSSLRFNLNRQDHFLARQIDTHEILGIVHPLFGEHTSSIESPVIVVIDGVIESLGEIDYLLRRAAETKCNLIICAMGFGADVVSTLSHNWKNNQLRVIPFWIQKWSEEKTVLQVCDEIGLTCVSSERGDSASILELDECSRIDMAFLSDHGLAIQSEGSDGGHLEVYFPQRLRGLAGLLEDRCRVGIRSCMSIASSGKGDLDFVHKITDPLEITTPQVSWGAQAVGVRAAASCEKIIDSLGCIIAP